MLPAGTAETRISACFLFGGKGSAVCSLPGLFFGLVRGKLATLRLSDRLCLVPESFRSPFAERSGPVGGLLPIRTPLPWHSPLQTANAGIFPRPSWFPVVGDIAMLDPKRRRARAQEFLRLS